MKNRILTFIIGILVGAILSTLGFLFYSKSVNKNPNQIMMPMDGKGQMQSFGESMGEPPSKPEGEFQENTQRNNI